MRELCRSIGTRTKALQDGMLRDRAGRLASDGGARRDLQDCRARAGCV